MLGCSRHFPRSSWLLLIIWLCAAPFYASSFLSSASESPSSIGSHGRLRLAYDENDISSKSIVPAGEEALHSAMMARSIRQMRNNRGLMKETVEEDEAILGKTRANLLLTRDVATKEKKKKKKSRGWSNIKGSPPSKRVATTSPPKTTTPPVKVDSLPSLNTVPKRSNGIDLPYSCTIQALQVYYAKHGDLVMPRRYPVPEEDGKPEEALFN